MHGVPGRGLCMYARGGGGDCQWDVMIYQAVTAFVLPPFCKHVKYAPIMPFTLYFYLFKHGDSIIKDALPESRVQIK